MRKLSLALDLEGVLITNAISQFPRPGLMTFLCQCEELFGRANICIFTSVSETRFRVIAHRLVEDGYAPEWFSTIRYIDWTGEHKDLRFVRDDIENVILVDDYPPYVKQTQQHRFINVRQYVAPHTHAMPDISDRELEYLLTRIERLINSDQESE